MKESKEIMVKMVIGLWKARIEETGRLFDSFSDAQFDREIAPGKNRGIYVLGHLIAAHDQMFPLLGLRNLIFPNYKRIFIDNPDRAIQEIPKLSDIRTNWKELHQELNGHITNMSIESWYHGHTSVSKQDFEKEPHRNKLNIVLTRTNHLNTHYGQLLLLK
jgi:hypothetical protein